MMILLLFNDSLELTMEKLHYETQLKMNLLIQALKNLVESKILTCTKPIDTEKLDINCKIKLSNEFRR